VLTVVGAGSIGLVLAARLARAGEAVRVCTRRADDARAIAEAGITVEEPDRGEVWRVRVASQTGPPEGERGPVLLCVRGPDTEAAGAALAAASPAATPVNVQNGVEGDALLAVRFERVLGAVIRQTCTRVAADRVRAQSGGRIVLGLHPRGTDPEAERLAGRLRAAGYDVAVSSGIVEDRWLKLCVNLTSTPNALVRPAEHETRAFVEAKARLLEEARDVLAAAGITARSCDGRDRSLDEEIVHQRRALERGHAARRLPLYNSVWQSLRRGGALEAEAWHRTLLDLGARHGVPTPCNARALELLLRAARDERGPECCGAEELLEAAAAPAGSPA
jgi:2-dehydropantoate 2-reductase